MEQIKKIVLVVCLCVGAMHGVAQTSSVIIRSGLLRAQATFSPSYMFESGQWHNYLHGNLEGYLSNKLSLSGEGYYYLGRYSSDSSLFAHNHGLFFGVSRHYIKNNNDVYVGFQPGIAITQLSAAANRIANSHTGVNPVFSCVAGYNFYVSRFFHFFIQSRLVLGEHTFDIRKNISDIRISAGLGFNINAIK